MSNLLKSIRKNIFNKIQKCNKIMLLMFKQYQTKHLAMENKVWAKNRAKKATTKRMTKTYKVREQRLSRVILKVVAIILTTKKVIL